MDLRKIIGATPLASVALAAPAAMAHDPKEHEREARETEMMSDGGDGIGAAEAAQLQDRA